MAKITYYLGAGASYHACPILNKQAVMMIEIARKCIYKKTDIGTRENYQFIDEELKTLPEDNRTQILWHIGYYGKKALKFNTIDTYARKLFLLGKHKELSKLKMCVSIFFDIWENFYDSDFRSLYLNDKELKKYNKIDYRYISLLSVLLEKQNNSIRLNDNVRFISWNYDLQLESAFRAFLERDELPFEALDQLYLKFKESTNRLNEVYHLNGHRGFFHEKRDKSNIHEVELKINSNTLDDYFSEIDTLYDATRRGFSDFNKFLKYAWEQNIENDWFSNIFRTIKETEILVIIGYSFPPFNREIDQLLFSKLNPNYIKEIVYQDPNANKEIILNLVNNPNYFENKINIENHNLDQFYLPHEYFQI